MTCCCRVTNLKHWTSSCTIIDKTLQLFSDLSVGLVYMMMSSVRSCDPYRYSSVRKLIKLESVQFILDNHTVSDLCGTLFIYCQVSMLQSANFPFLDVSFHNLDLRYRTMFYRSLGRLFLAFQNEDEDRFITFVAPLTGELYL